MNIPTYVIASRKRRPLITPYLGRIPHTVLWDEEKTLPAGWFACRGYEGANCNALGAYRCWEGHRRALREFHKTRESLCLVLEDDGVPNRSDWHDVVDLAAQIMCIDPDKYPVISLHTRAMDKRCWNIHPFGLGCELWEKIPGAWCCATLGYLVTREAARQLEVMPFVGPAIDQAISWLHYWVVEPSPIDHDPQALQHTLMKY